MKLMAISFAAISVLAFSSQLLFAALPQNDILKGDVGRKILEAVQAADKAGFSGVVLAELRGEVIASVAVGSRGDAVGNPNDTETLFEIGSVTKPLTAVTVLILAQQGKLSLDDSISKHLPNVPGNCQGITVRHLLQHTSGIPGTNYGPQTADVAEIVPIYLTGGPKHEPGTNHEYWNQGYALLSAIIAGVSDAEYTDATRELVFKPAGMMNSCFTGDPPEGHENVAIGQATQGASRSALEPPYGDFYGLQYRGMGGAVCNAGDIYNLIKSIRAGELLSDESRQEMLTPGQGQYGIGWRVEEIGESQRRVFHTGSVRGFLASVSWYPEDESCLIVLANTDNGSPVFEVDSACRKILQSQFVRVPESQAFSQEMADSLTGLYAGGLPNGRNLEIAIRQNGVALDVFIDWGGPKSTGRLESGDKDMVWLVDGSPERLEINLVPGPDGKIEALKTMGAEFKRK